MTKIWVFIKKSDFNPKTDREFLHYWSNDGENFPEFSTDLETWLAYNYPKYEWKEIQGVVTRESAVNLTIEYNNSDLSFIQDYFVRIGVNNYNPALSGVVEPYSYYKSNRVGQPSYQNYDKTKNIIYCELDFWSTFGFSMFQNMKEFPEPLLFMRKMEDRFLYDEINEVRYLDYNTQTQYKNYGSWQFNLFKNQDEKPLNVHDWCKLNNSEYDKDFYIDYEPSIPVPSHKLKDDGTHESIIDGFALDTATTGDGNKIQMLQYKQKGNYIDDIFKNDVYNNAGSYRYIIGRTSNDAQSNEGIDTSNLSLGSAFPNNLYNIPLISGGSTNFGIKLVNDYRMVIPVRKDNPNYDQSNPYFNETISTIFKYGVQPIEKTAGVVLGSSGILGMVVCDIPPSVLGASIRGYSNDNNTQLMGNILSYYDVTIDNVRYYNKNYDYTNLAILVKSDDTGFYVSPTPTFFIDLGSIPIAIAGNKKDSVNTFENYKFFDNIKNLLIGVKEENISNTYENEPYLYAPMFNQWVYRIDGQDTLSLTLDQLNLKELSKKLKNNEDWKIYLNTTFLTKTYYKLDLKDLKNDHYPFTKSFIELTSQDNRQFPYATSNYTNWLETNESTLSTSRQALDYRQNYGAFESGMGVLGSLVGAGIGGAILGPIGAIGGITNAVSTGLSIPYTMSYNEKVWTNQWNRQLTNLYKSPSSLSSAGFTSGSLNYDSMGESDENLYLFRTYEMPLNNKLEIWNDISMSGYYLNSLRDFSDYDKRKNFNYFSIDITNKQFQIYNYLKHKTLNNSLVLSQRNYIDWFLAKLQQGVRIFKNLYSGLNMQNLIVDNIENYAPYINIEYLIQGKNHYVPYVPEQELILSQEEYGLNVVDTAGNEITDITYYFDNTDTFPIPDWLTIDRSTGVLKTKDGMLTQEFDGIIVVNAISPNFIIGVKVNTWVIRLVVSNENLLILNDTDNLLTNKTYNNYKYLDVDLRQLQCSLYSGEKINPTSFEITYSGNGVKNLLIENDFYLRGQIDLENLDSQLTRLSLRAKYNSNGVELISNNILCSWFINKVNKVNEIDVTPQQGIVFSISHNETNDLYFENSTCEIISDIENNKRIRFYWENNQLYEKSIELCDLGYKNYDELLSDFPDISNPEKLFMEKGVYNDTHSAVKLQCDVIGSLVYSWGYVNYFNSIFVTTPIINSYCDSLIDSSKLSYIINNDILTSNYSDPKLKSEINDGVKQLYICRYENAGKIYSEKSGEYWEYIQVQDEYNLSLGVYVEGNGSYNINVKYKMFRESLFDNSSSFQTIEVDRNGNYYYHTSRGNDFSVNNYDIKQKMYISMSPSGTEGTRGIQPKVDVCHPTWQWCKNRRTYTPTGGTPGANYYAYDGLVGWQPNNNIVDTKGRRNNIELTLSNIEGLKITK